MSFVIYDVETTGLSRGFDQIVQFAAVHTDAELNIIDKAELCCRLLPHVIPSPEALLVTGARISELTDVRRPTHYQMIAQLRAVVSGWCPALFLGFNSIAFDEEFLRHAFYQCLHSPFLTNTQGSARADVLNLCRITAALEPSALTPSRDSEGRPIFKLKPLAQANGIVVSASHEAAADVFTTLAMCRHIRALAPGMWSQFLRFSQRATVESFIMDEEAFLLSETFGNHHRARIVTRIGRHPDQPNRHYCFDLSADVAAIQALTADELIEACRSATRPVVTIRTNAAPTLWALYDATPEHIAPFDEAAVLDRVALVRNDTAFVHRLCQAAREAAPTYPPSSHVEEQLYERGFPSLEDEILMARFHASAWGERSALWKEFADDRYRRLARRLIYFDQPHLLDPAVRLSIASQIDRRLTAPAEAQEGWRSIPAALREADILIESGLDDDEDLARLHEYRAYLLQRRAGAC